MKQHQNLFRRKAAACLIFVLAAVYSQTAVSQLVVNPGGSPNIIINNLLGAGLTVVPGSVSINCGISSATARYGTFNGSASNLGLNNGVILTTGRAADAVGPNPIFPNVSTSFNVTLVDPQI